MRMVAEGIKTTAATVDLARIRQRVFRVVRAFSP